MIPDETVERVRETADIVGVIGEYVELKRQGADYRGPCPFHQGTHRNFSVSPRKQMYYCFVCHESGDVFKFLTTRLGVDWPTAVRMVAERLSPPAFTVAPLTSARFRTSALFTATAAPMVAVLPLVATPLAMAWASVLALLLRLTGPPAVTVTP